MLHLVFRYFSAVFAGGGNRLAEDTADGAHGTRIHTEGRQESAEVYTYAEVGLSVQTADGKRAENCAEVNAALICEVSGCGSRLGSAEQAAKQTFKVDGYSGVFGNNGSRHILASDYRSQTAHGLNEFNRDKVPQSGNGKHGIFIHCAIVSEFEYTAFAGFNLTVAVSAAGVIADMEYSQIELTELAEIGGFVAVYQLNNFCDIQIGHDIHLIFDIRGVIVREDDAAVEGEVEKVECGILRLIGHSDLHLGIRDSKGGDGGLDGALFIPVLIAHILQCNASELIICKLHLDGAAQIGQSVYEAIPIGSAEQTVYGVH